MKKIFIIPLLMVAFVLSSCIDRTYFGLSDSANILSFDIDGQLSNTIEPMVDWRDMGKVTITVSNTYNLSALTVNKATCSQLATFDIDPFTITDFSEPVYINVQAEDESVVKCWEITVTLSEASSQLSFSDMNSWTVAKDSDGSEISFTQLGITSYGYFPGNGSDLSPWQSPAEANAFSLAGINYFTVYPMPTASSATYSRIETINVTSSAAVLANAQVVTGALFAGEFIFNMSYAPVTGTNEPRKMVNIGTNFYSRPTAATVRLRYQPGETMMDGTGTSITVTNADGRPQKDSCDIYFLLQNRTDDATKLQRIATAHLRTSETLGDMDSSDGFVEVTIPFVYGEPTSDQLAEKPYAQIGGARGELVFYNFSLENNEYVITSIDEVYASDPESLSVTHIAVLFSSSAYGDNFWGAPGSVLDIDNVELVY